MKRRGWQGQLGPSLRAVLGRLDRKNAGAAASARVGRAWLAVATPSVLSHTTGAYLKDGTLTVYVDSPVWATELTAMAERYRTSINTEVAQDLVSNVRFSVSRKVALQHRLVKEEVETEEFYKDDDVPSVPLSTGELDRVVKSVEAIADPELREAALRATVKDLEWKKGIAAHKSREKPREGL